MLAWPELVAGIQYPTIGKKKLHLEPAPVPTSAAEAVTFQTKPDWQGSGVTSALIVSKKKETLYNPKTESSGGSLGNLLPGPSSPLIIPTVIPVRLESGAGTTLPIQENRDPSQPSMEPSVECSIP